MTKYLVKIALYGFIEVEGENPNEAIAKIPPTNTRQFPEEVDLCDWRVASVTPLENEPGGE